MLIFCSSYRGFTEPCLPWKVCSRVLERRLPLLNLRWFRTSNAHSVLAVLREYGVPWPLMQTIRYVTKVRAESGFSRRTRFPWVLAPPRVAPCLSVIFMDRILIYVSAFCRWYVSDGVISLWPSARTECSECEADGMRVKWWIAPSGLGVSYCPKRTSSSTLGSSSRVRAKRGVSRQVNWCSVSRQCTGTF